MTIGQTIGKLRKDRGWSQEQLAEQLKVSRQAVSKWELDASVPDVEKIIAISQLFGISTDELLKGKKEEVLTTESGTGRKKKRWKRWAGGLLLALLCLLVGLWLDMGVSKGTFWFSTIILSLINIAFLCGIAAVIGLAGRALWLYIKSKK